MGQQSEQYQKTHETVRWYELEVGGVYYYKSGGTGPFSVTRIEYGGREVLISYLDSPDQSHRVRIVGYSFHKASRIKGQEENKMNNQTLYQIKGTDTYCTYLATRSDGKLVVELKGTAEIQTVGKEQLEEVVPFTFAVQFSGTGIAYHFLGDSGSVSVGDLVVRTDASYFGSFGIVTGIDTKSRQATKRFTGKLLQVSKDLK